MGITENINNLWKQVDLSEIGWTAHDTAGQNQQNSRNDIFTNPEAISRWLGQEIAEELLPKAEALTELTPEDVKAADDAAATKLDSYMLRLAVEVEAIQREFEEAAQLCSQMEIPADFRRVNANHQNKKGLL